MAAIGITGATGGIGGRVAGHLADQGVEQRLLLRDRSRAPELPGAEIVEFGGYRDGEGMSRVLEGVETLLLVSAGESAKRVEEHDSAIDAAVAAGVARIVYISFLSAAPDATFTFARDHFHAEEHINSTGLAWTFLRDSIYLDYIPLFAGGDGVIRGPAGDGRIAPVARDDVGEVAAAVLTSGGEHDGQAYPVTGPEAFTLREAAETLSRVTGREVRYVEETLEEARESRAPSGAPDWEIEGWVTSYAQIATGEMDVVSDTVERLAGHPPLTLEEFLRRHTDSWQHLTH
jgi:NAD(P)H dehydrogenase (quinone)